MQQSFNGITFLTGDSEVLEKMKTVQAHPMFYDRTIEFLGALSSKILSDKRTKVFADVVSYAFWIRRKSLEKVRSEYHNIGNRIGRGVAFHITPSNVPVNFAVSFTSALLAGNACIVRVTDKNFEQINIITDAVNSLFLGDFPDMKQYLCLIRYAHNEDITQTLSSMCDIRIIWGGNQTIDIIRKAKLPPRTIELAFADRHSVALINADQYLKADVKKVAKDFYTDTYYTDQNACSSPRIVVWFGKEREKARELFWSSLAEIVKEKYVMQPILAIDKLTSLCTLSSEHKGVRIVGNDNIIFRVQLDNIADYLMNYKNGGGYFFEYLAEDISEIAPLFSKSCQTLSYYGMDAEEIRKYVYENGPRGIDRIVPMGQTMELSFKWDGFDMIETMSRFIYCK